MCHTSILKADATPKKTVFNVKEAKMILYVLHKILFDKVIKIANIQKF
jgi:hypothetical protein